jgi:hypothetical protein
VAGARDLLGDAALVFRHASDPSSHDSATMKFGSLGCSMRRILGIAVLMALALAAVAAYQIGAVYLANMELAGDLKDLSSLTGTRIGLVDPRSPDQIRDLVIQHAAQHGIHLGPEQVNVERSGEGKDGTIYLFTAYDVPMNVFGVSWTIHFTAAGPKPSS